MCIPFYTCACVPRRCKQGTKSGISRKCLYINFIFVQYMLTFGCCTHLVLNYNIISTLIYFRRVGVRKENLFIPFKMKTVFSLQNIMYLISMREEVGLQNMQIHKSSADLRWYCFRVHIRICNCRACICMQKQVCHRNRCYIIKCCGWPVLCTSYIYLVRGPITESSLTSVYINIDVNMNY